MAARGTYRIRVVGFACIGMLWAMAASCAMDERDVQLVSTLSDGGQGPEGVQTETDMLQTTPVLEVRPPAVDLGAVTTGFASRGRVKVINSGTAVLPPPRIEWAASNSADYEIIQNQCQSEVPPGGSCEVRVQLVPSRAGVVEAALQVSSAAGGSVTVPFNGEGFAAGSVILSPAVGSSEDYGSVRLGGMLEGAFSIFNPGPASSGALSFRLNRPEFTLLPPQPGECMAGVTDLAAGKSCDARVAFAPSERGPLEATLTATTTGAGSVSLNLAGNGLIAGVLEASSSTVDFSGVVLGSSGFGSVHFKNQGDEPITLGGARLEPSDVTEFSILNSTCGSDTALAAGAGCDVEIEFRPTVLGEERAADLLLDATGLEALRVGLVGHGLEPGSLVLQASAPGEENFGDVLLAQTVTRVFQVSNPGAQPSGVLSLATSGSFDLAATPEAGDCVDGTTSLVNGESCNVRLSFTPTVRGAQTGALTVSSALAGAGSLTLTGQGILPAKFDVGAEVNFGRVLTNETAERTISVKNAGDQPLPPPGIQVTSGSPAQAAAFSVVSGCTAPLAFGEECTITVTFAPSNAVPHSANLNLSSEPGGTASLLLLGEALTPGSLELAAAVSPDFGDVPLGTTLNRSFTLRNPGNVASGLLTITTDNNHFRVSPGDCNQGAPEGLVDGSSCTFSVGFTPDGSDPVVGNITVQSSGAGRAGREIRGRGRSPARLRADTGSRDLGRANIGRQPSAANQFAWTVSNDGDLASGALRVTRGSVNEFRISGDTCTNSQLAGHSSCQIQISFVPAEPPGPRSESVVVTDTASSRSVTLALTAVSVRVAGPGQSCINAECSQGICTDGVCCDRACDRTCQQCSQTGVCVDQTSQEQCGNGNARCFGVDQCLLPAGQACGANTDCGGGLQCKQCLSGGRQCTAPSTCCGGCPGNQACTNGSCGCSAQQIDCGGGLCIPRNTGNVCCPSNPSCPGNLPACTSDGRCVQCLTNAQCGACSTCNTATNTCTPRARGTGGVCSGQQLCDGAGACFTPACGATGAPACGDCRTCQDFQCRTGNENGVCQGNGQCVGGNCRPGPGRACQQGGTPCANNLPCTNGVCQLPTVGNGQACGANANCDTALGLQCVGGTCGCGGGRQFARGQCRIASGQPCSSNGAAGCADNVCTEWLVDADGDGIGSFGEVAFGQVVPSLFICGDTSLSNEPAPYLGIGCRGGNFEHRYVPRSAGPQGRIDCCDLDYRCGFVGFSPNETPSTDFFPGQTTPHAGFGAGPLGTGCSPSQDYNCDGQVVPVAISNGSGTVSNCSQAGCAERFNKVACELAPAASCLQNSGVAGPPRCGLVTDIGCSLSPTGTCQFQGAGQITVLCL
jgi:Abnormal spindle-like microcephaly-assoc'd, ASPM-SPD-2-Hydin